MDVFKDNIHLDEGTVVDTTFMSADALRLFLSQQIEEAKNQNLLFLYTLKATMMKVSDLFCSDMPYPHSLKTRFKISLHLKSLAPIQT